MDTSSRQPRPVTLSRTTWVWLVLGLAAWIFVLRAPFIAYPLNQDEGLFMVVADRWRHGALLYRDVWDNKPPGIFAAYAAIQTVFGTSILAMHVAAGLIVFGTAILVGLVAARLSGNRVAGLIAAFVLPAYTLDLGGDGLEPELAMMLPQSLAVLLLSRFLCPVPTPRLAVPVGLAIGAIEGALFETKFPAALEALALGCAALLCLTLHRGRVVTGAKFTGAALAGFAVVPLIVFVGFTAAGTWPDLVYSNFVSTKLYVTAPFGIDHPIQSLVTVIKRVSYFAPLLAITALFVVMRLRTIWRERSGYVAWSLPAFWLLAATVGAAASGYHRYYYFQSLAPSAAILASMSFARLLEGQRGRQLVARGAAGVALCTAVLVIPKLAEHARKLHATMFDRDYRMQRALLPIIEENEGATGRSMFLTDLTPGLYTLTNTQPSTRYPQAIAHIFDLPEKFGVDPVRELRSVLAARPVLIIGTPNSLGPTARYAAVLQPALEADYRQIIPTDPALAGSVLIFKRRS